MKTRVILVLSMLAALVVGAIGAVTSAQSLPVIDIYKSPTCRCCSNWVNHLRQDGFTVRTTQLSDDQLASFKARHGVPAGAQSCHTALMAGYVVEGHVPAVDVRRLLTERPAVLGLAVPGMPRGTPGMEVWGVTPQPYTVVAFDKQGRTRTFATRR